VDISLAYLRDLARRRVAERPKIRLRAEVPAVVHSRPLPEGDWYAGKIEAIAPGLPPGGVDLAFLDPPFNIGKRYGGRVDDRLGDGRYAERLGLWLDCVLPLVQPEGSVVLHHVPHWATWAADYLAERGWFLRRWVAWRTNGGMVRKDADMTPNHYPFLWFARSERVKPNRILVPHPRCARCGDYSSHWGGKEKFRDPDGLALGDVWLTPTRVNGRGKTRRANELPLEAPLRWVLALTDPGDYVFDPFLGSGTTGAACELSGRRWGGVELVQGNSPAIRAKTLVARGAARVTGEVDALPADARYALTKALERAWGDAVREDGQVSDEDLLGIGARAASAVLEEGQARE
jgi:site-specific DNA-methyltransferase (adenine-specific)